MILVRVREIWKKTCATFQSVFFVVVNVMWDWILLRIIAICSHTVSLTNAETVVSQLVVMVISLCDCMILSTPRF